MCCFQLEEYVFIQQAKHAKLAAESSSETSTCVAVDQKVHDGESLLIDLKIRLPDGEVTECYCC